MNPFPKSNDISTFTILSNKILQFQRSKIQGLPIIVLELSIDSTKNIISRSVYNILQLLGDFGGFQAVIESIATFLVLPYSSFNFYVKIISKLFLAATKHQNLIGQSFGKRG